MSQFDFFDPLKSPEALDRKAKHEREHAERCRIAKLASEIERKIKPLMLERNIWGYPSLVRNPNPDAEAWKKDVRAAYPGFYNIEPEPEPKVIVYAYPGHRDAPGIIEARDVISTMYPCEIRTKGDRNQYEYY